MKNQPIGYRGFVPVPRAKEKPAFWSTGDIVEGPEIYELGFTDTTYVISQEEWAHLDGMTAEAAMEYILRKAGATVKSCLTCELNDPGRQCRVSEACLTGFPEVGKFDYNNWEPKVEVDHVCLRHMRRHRERLAAEERQADAEVWKARALLAERNTRLYNQALIELRAAKKKARKIPGPPYFQGTEYGWAWVLEQTIEYATKEGGLHPTSDWCLIKAVRFL